MLGLEEIAMTPQKAAHPTDNDSESSDDEDDAGRGLLVSGSQRRPGHAHTRSLSLNRGTDIWQQVKNIVIEVSGCRLPVGCILKFLISDRLYLPSCSRQWVSCSLES